MPDGFEFDHTSVAVRDVDTAARWVRRELGATPIAGEVLQDFRYALFHVGDADGGGRLELMQPESGDGFLSRFVDKHGEAPHHLTFTVPDLPEAVRQVRGLGLQVVGEDYSYERWREAFVMPDPVHRVVVQLAETSASFPSPQELVASRYRDVDSFPGNRGAVDPRWWEFVWEEEPARSATLVSTKLNSRDVDLSQALFGDVLRGVATPEQGGTRFTWTNTSLLVVSDGNAGVTAIQCRGSLPDHLHVGLLPIEEVV